MQRLLLVTKLSPIFLNRKFDSLFTLLSSTEEKNIPSVQNQLIRQINEIYQSEPLEFGNAIGAYIKRKTKTLDRKKLDRCLKSIKIILASTELATETRRRLMLLESAASKAALERAKNKTQDLVTKEKEHLARKAMIIAQMQHVKAMFISLDILASTRKAVYQNYGTQDLSISPRTASTKIDSDTALLEKSGEDFLKKLDGLFVISDDMTVIQNRINLYLKHLKLKPSPQKIKEWVDALSSIPKTHSKALRENTKRLNVMNTLLQSITSFKSPAESKTTESCDTAQKIKSITAIPIHPSLDLTLLGDSTEAVTTAPETPTPPVCTIHYPATTGTYTPALQASCAFFSTSDTLLKLSQNSLAARMGLKFPA